MIQRTHDLAAVVLVSYSFMSQPIETLNWETILGIGIASIIGAMLPDIDNVASPAWKHKLLPREGLSTREFLEGHRHLSHSLIGGVIFTVTIGFILNLIHLPHLQINPVIQAFILGFLSHLIVDSLTREGVPWLFPIPWHLGFPPFKFLRMKTGGWIEKMVVFPLLLLCLIWIYVAYQNNLILLIKSF